MVKILTSVFHFRAFLLQFLINQKIRDPAPGCPLLPAVFFFCFFFFFLSVPLRTSFPACLAVGGARRAGGACYPAGPAASFGPLHAVVPAVVAAVPSQSGAIGCLRR